MGNITSQIGNSSSKYKLEPPSCEAVQLSLPRVNHHQQQLQQQQQQKVLPVSKDPPPKLKPTENGRILLAGGTLTGRHQGKISRGNFMNAKEKVKFLKETQEDRSQRSHHHKDLTKKFGSEPDLRCHLRVDRSSATPKRYAATKKLNHANSLDKRSRELENFCENIQSFATKRTGLFRTRAESRKKHQPSFNALNDNTINGSGEYSTPQKESTEAVAISNTKDDLESAGGEPRESNKKKYYFGMENNNYIENLDYINYEIEDYDVTKLSDEIRSNFSNNFGEDDDNNESISLYLRPILPKKQLDMPKFSSSLAWKLLYSAGLDSTVDDSTTNNEDEQLFSEERIEKALPVLPQRLLPNKSLDFQFSQDKSGDSGISGDETPKPALSHYKSKQSWTPQQDLGDDSSTDDEMRFNSMPYATGANKPHVFSLSLPRDNLEWYKAQVCSNNRLQRSASGVLGNIGTASNDATPEAVCATKNFNWLLSKSAPNSLNNGFNSLESAYVYNEELTSLVPLNGHQTAKRRIIYLPGSDVSEGALPDNKMRARMHLNASYEKDGACEDFVREVEKREQERLKEIETMQRIEEEFRRKRSRYIHSRYNNLYSNTRQNFRKALLPAAEKSV